MKKIFAVWLGLLIELVLGACNASSVTQDVPQTVQPTDTVFVSPTSTVFFIPTVDPLTPTAIAKFFHTLEATTVTPEATFTPSYEDCSSRWASGVRGNWALCSGFENPITVVNVSGKTWMFSYSSYYGRDVKNLCTRLYHLTSDEKFLYFSLDTECELIEPGFVSSISLFRMDLSSGEVIEILKSSYDFDSYTGSVYTASISPTGRRLAYIYHQKPLLELKVLDFQTGEARSIPLEEKYESGGMFSWSEDGTKLAFMLESERDNEHFISMIFLDLFEDDSIVTFIKDKEFSWISSRLEVTNSGVKVIPYFDMPLFYDVETGVLSPATE